MHVPDGWFKYSRYGTPIGETRIIAVKTPLKQAFNNGRSRGKVLSQHLDERGGVPTEEEFTPTQLVEQLRAGGWNLRAVIDLTFTSRYYNPKELEDLGVQYSKVFCPGREIPNDEVYLDFATSLSKYLESCCENGDVVAVHCTHGLNRTGYLVCRYLIDKQQFSAEDAIQAFNIARGYDIERENYLQHLRAGCPPLPPPQNPPRQFQRRGDQQQQQHCHQRDTPHSSREPQHYDQYRPPPPPHRQFQRETWRQDWQERGQSEDQSSETRGRDRKKKHHRRKRQSSREPQPSPGPVPLFPEHNGQCPSAQGPTPIPLFPGRDLIPPSYDQGSDYHGQDSSKRSERANSKYRRKDKGRHKRKQRPYESSTSLPSRTGSGSSEKDSGSFTNDASHRPSYESDCMEPEGLSSGSPWARAHSRGRGRWEGEEGHHSTMEMDQSPGDWSHHDPWSGWGNGRDDGGSYYGASHNMRSDSYHWRPK